MPKSYEVERAFLEDNAHGGSEDAIGTFDTLEDATVACEEDALEGNMDFKTAKKAAYRIWEIDGNYSRVVDVIKAKDILAEAFKR